MTAACYLYCLVRGNIKNLNLTGINGQKVYSVEVDDINVIIHKCTPPDCDKLKNKILDHNRVIEEIQVEKRNIIPLKCGTIMKNRDQIISWVSRNRKAIECKFRMLEGKEEYIIKFIINKYNYFTRKKAGSTDRGSNNFNQQDNNLKQLLNKNIDFLKDYICRDILEITSDLTINSSKKGRHQGEIIVEVAVLIEKQKLFRLNNKLQEMINNKEGIRIYLSGPWPGYSFIEEFYN